MPLAFQSLSHGEVAFGFFNIETDMLLLNNHFFFAPDFCAAIIELATLKAYEPAHVDMPGYVLAPEVAGNLHGAIQGTDLRGFIGETYRLFPFPADRDAFRQNPEGYRTREIIEAMVRRYAGPGLIRLIADRYSDNFIIGPYTFIKEAFEGLLDYVWVGGMPRWKGDVRPSYVEEMKEAVLGSVHPLFRNVDAFH
jgi:hypothetical protein